MPAHLRTSHPTAHAPLYNPYPFQPFLLQKVRTGYVPPSPQKGISAIRREDNLHFSVLRLFQLCFPWYIHYPWPAYI